VLHSYRSKEEFYSDMLKFKEEREERLRQKRKEREDKELMACRSTSRTRERSPDLYDRLYQQHTRNLKQSASIS